jgi:hypothetical protein
MMGRKQDPDDDGEWDDSWIHVVFILIPGRKHTENRLEQFKSDSLFILPLMCPWLK